MNDDSIRHPTLGNGKIGYLEIPATDAARSADFYQTVFGWQVRKRGDGSAAFDDGVNEVSGTWVLGRPAMSQAGLLIYIMVESVAETAKIIAANGGKIARAPGGTPPQITALFLDPAGNLFGIGEQ